MLEKRDDVVLGLLLDFQDPLACSLPAVADVRFGGFLRNTDLRLPWPRRRPVRRAARSRSDGHRDHSSASAGRDVAFNHGAVPWGACPFKRITAGDSMESNATGIWRGGVQCGRRAGPAAGSPLWDFARGLVSLMTVPWLCRCRHWAAWSASSSLEVARNRR